MEAVSVGVLAVVMVVALVAAPVAAVKAVATVEAAVVVAMLRLTHRPQPATGCTRVGTMFAVS